MSALKKAVCASLGITSGSPIAFNTMGKRASILPYSFSKGGLFGSFASVVSGVRATIGTGIPFVAAHPATLAASFEPSDGNTCLSSWSKNPLVVAFATADGCACGSFYKRSLKLPLVGIRRGPFSGLSSISPHTRSMEAAPGRLAPFAVRFVSTSAASTPPFQPTIICVKVGSGGRYLNWAVKWDDLKGMEIDQLLEELADGKMFGAKLERVNRSECVIGIISGLAEPDVLTEATKFVEIIFLTTVVDATMAGKCTGERLFIHVRLPGAEPVGLHVLRHPGVDAATARAAMHPQWQDIATRLECERKAMIKYTTLHREKAIISAAEAPSLDMTVLGKDPTTGIVHLGVCKMPSIPRDIMSSPKGFWLAEEDRSWFYLEQRATICHEFLHAMMGKRDPERTSFGVLLSGPNGTGKSAIGVETALTCFARGMVSIYISTSSSWVYAAKTGGGDSYLLERLLHQNADLIAAQPALRNALAPALVLEPGAVRELDAHASNKIMDALRSALTTNPSLQVGLIADQAQTISEAISGGIGECTNTEPRVGAEYFLQWHNWDNRNRVFVRLDIASNHGARELKLPLGEMHRLRIIKPLSPELVTALTTGVGSPYEFPKAHESARQGLVFAAGGILVSLLRGMQLLKNALAAYDRRSATENEDEGLPLPRAICYVETALSAVMEDNCSWWFRTLTAEEKSAASSGMLQLVRGEVSWVHFKGLYDDGLVAHYDHSSYVMPSSALASSIIMKVLARHYFEAVRKPLHSIESGVERSIALELQVIAHLAITRAERLPAMTLKGDGSAPRGLACSDEPLPFDGIDDLKESEELTRLYVPTSKSFACDAIIIPPFTLAVESEPIVVWEMSITSPRDPKRVDKVLKWFGAEGIVTALLAARPGRPIVCALCWPEKFDAATPQETRYSELSTAADVASKQSTSLVSVVVVDMTGLQLLGVLL